MGVVDGVGAGGAGVGAGVAPPPPPPQDVRATAANAQARRCNRGERAPVKVDCDIVGFPETQEARHALLPGFWRMLAVALRVAATRCNGIAGHIARGEPTVSLPRRSAALVGQSKPAAQAHLRGRQFISGQRPRMACRPARRSRTSVEGTLSRRRHVDRTSQTRLRCSHASSNCERLLPLHCGSSVARIAERRSAAAQAASSELSTITTE